MLEHTTDKSLLTSNTLQLYQQLIYFIANHFHCLMKTNERIPDLNDGLYYLDLWATIPYMENIFQNSWNILKNSTKTCLFFLTNTFTNKNTDVIWWLILYFLLLWKSDSGLFYGTTSRSRTKVHGLRIENLLLILKSSKNKTCLSKCRWTRFQTHQPRHKEPSKLRHRVR